MFSISCNGQTETNKNHLIRFFANRRPNAATPVAGDDGKSSREVYSFSAIERHAAGRRSNARSGVNHLHPGGRNNIGSTIGTSRGDRLDKSSLCVSTPRAAAKR